VLESNPSTLGARAEMAVASALHRAGHEVFVPLFAANGRVDLVADGPTGLQRIQVKTARLVKGALMFKTCSNTRNQPVDYRGEVDAFGVHAPDLDLVYLVPIEVTSIRGCSLRLEPPRNNQHAGIRWASDHLVGPP
jgi:hypothetical protein